jgi:hypothetical protein
MPLVLALAATGPGLVNVVTGTGSAWLLPAMVDAALGIMGLVECTLADHRTRGAGFAHGLRRVGLVQAGRRLSYSPSPSLRAASSR